MSPSSRAAATTAPRSNRWLIVVAAAALVGVLLVVLGQRAAPLIPRFSAYVASLGPAGPAVFVVGYALATVGFIPGSLLTLSAGAIFGLGWGVVLVFIAATLGSTLAFLIARYGARKAIARRVDSNPQFAAVNRAIAAQGRRIVFLLRLSPAFPFSLLNYALGLTTVSLRDYVLAGIGMLPGTVLYVYYGKLAGDVASLASGAAPARGTGYYAVLGLGLLATIAVTTIVTRTARRALRDATAAAAPGEVT